MNILRRSITKQATHFVFIGIISTAINYTLFSFLFFFSLFSYVVSSGIGYVSGMIFGFVYNRKLTFYSKEKVQRSFFVYLFVYLFSLALSLFLLDFFVENYNTNIPLTNLSLLVLAAVTNFLGVKIFAFKNKEW